MHILKERRTNALDSSVLVICIYIHILDVNYTFLSNIVTYMVILKYMYPSKKENYRNDYKKDYPVEPLP